MAETVQVLEGYLASDQPHFVVTADASGLVIAKERPELAEIYRTCSLATADSTGVVWAAKRKGRRIERVSGVDLVDRLVRLSAEKGHRIVIIGAAPGVADLAAERLRLRHPGANFVGTHHGYFPPEDDDVVAQEMAKFQPDILFVAMGIPRQEIFIQRTLQILRPKVAMGVGGSFDVFSGRVKRAPKIIQALRMEWAWRLLLNPSKISKVKLLPRFVWMVLRGK